MAVPTLITFAIYSCMMTEVTHPWAAGIVLSAILSALMSTIDSQLLVSSSALIEDLYHKTFRRHLGPREAAWRGRICVIVISSAALLLALRPDDTILGIVAYAWGGFGAAFGPLILFALFSRRTTWQAALTGRVTGTTVLVVWKLTGWSEHLYKIVPGFVADAVVILLVNQVVRQDNTLVLQRFAEVVRVVRGMRHGQTDSDLEGAPSFERT